MLQVGTLASAGAALTLALWPSKKQPRARARPFEDLVVTVTGSGPPGPTIDLAWTNLVDLPLDRASLVIREPTGTFVEPSAYTYTGINFHEAGARTATIQFNSGLQTGYWTVTLSVAPATDKDVRVSLSAAFPQ